MNTEKKDNPTAEAKKQAQYDTGAFPRTSAAKKRSMPSGTTLSKSLEEDAVFSEHTDSYWAVSDRLGDDLIQQTFSVDSPDAESMRPLLEANQDLLLTIGLSPELLRIYVASGITILTQEAIRRGIPHERVMEIKRRAFVHLSESETMEEWRNISQNVTDSLHQEYLASLQQGTHPLVRKAEEYIYLHRQKPISARDVAEQLHVDRTYLARLFQEDLHTSISDHILSVKMEEAAEWLRQGKYSLQEIAANLGFSSYAYFSKRFKEYYGVSPREYRDQADQNTTCTSSI